MVSTPRQAESLYATPRESKIAVYLFLGLLKGRPSYRRASKENIQHLKNQNNEIW
jgi:hypothetical protein